MKLVCNCSICGKEITVNNNIVGRLINRGKPILCTACGRGQYQIDYADYIRSDAWRVKADAAKARAGHKCQVCGSVERLEVHHNTYDRLGAELPTDLVVLCRKHHKLFHGVTE